MKNTDERLRQVLLHLEKKTRAIQEIRDLIAKSQTDGEGHISLEIKKKADEIFGCLNAVAAIVGGKASKNLNKQIHKLQEQWLWLVDASDVFHLGLGEMSLTERWLTNANTLEVQLDRKKNWQASGKVNPMSGDIGGAFSYDGR